MKNQQGENRGPVAIVIIAAVLLLLAGLAFMGQRAAATDVVEKLYSGVLTSPPARPELYPTEDARLERSKKLLNKWHALDRSTINLEEVGADLPLPLRLTRTIHVANPESLRKLAAAIFARDLAALSGRHVAVSTPTAWEPEIAVWRAAIGH